LNNVFKYGFGEKRGFTAALIGAHTIGSANLENSGYQGSWSEPAEMGTWNNDYFRSLILKGWDPNLNIDGNPEKN